MKKLTPVVFAAFLICSLGSCYKQHVCVCDIKDPASYTGATPQWTWTGTTRAQAESGCADMAKLSDYTNCRLK